jgi:vitamin B12 transporter
MGTVFLFLFTLVSSAHADLPELPELDSGTAKIELLAPTTVEEKQFAKSAQVTIEDVLRSLPGVTVTRSGALGQPSFVFLRGANSDGTLVMIDGLPINDPSLSNAAFDFSTISLADVERVDVWKGPQSVLFGQGATGGAINIITKRGAGPATGLLSAEVGSFNTFIENARVAGGNDHVAYSFAANRLQTNGFSAASQDQGGAERDGASQTSFASKLSWSPDRTSELEFIGRYTGKKADLDYAPSSVGPYFIEPDAPNYKTWGDAVTLALKGKKTWGTTWTSEISASRFSQDRYYSNDPDPNNTASLRSKYNGELQQFENVNHWKAPGLEIAFGPRAQFEAATIHSTSNTADFSLPAKETSLAGFFARAQAQGPRLFSTEGARIETHSQFGTSIVYEVAPGMHITDDEDAIFRYATGYKAPTLYQLYEPKYGNAALKPENDFSFELTLNHSFMKKAGKLSVTAFRNQAKNLIQFGNSNYSNIGSALTRGFEAGLDLKINRLILQGAYTYLDTRDDSTGQSLMRRPRNTLSGRAEYRFLDTLSASLDFLTIDRRTDLDPLSGAPEVVAGYQTLNAAVFFYPLKDLRLSLRAINLLGKQYEETAGYTGTPRSFFIGAAFTH